jgi:hypothetical protein
MDLYCVKCKTRTSTNDVMTITSKNNRTALTGKCVTCGINFFRFLKKNSEVTLQPNWQNSQEPHGLSIQDKNISPDIATVVPEHD